MALFVLSAVQPLKERSCGIHKTPWLASLLAGMSFFFCRASLQFWSCCCNRARKPHIWATVRWAKLRVDRHSSAVRITCDMVEITGPNCLLLESKRSHLNQAVWPVISAITWNPNSSMQVPVPARNLVQFRNWQDTVSPLAATATVMRPA